MDGVMCTIGGMLEMRNSWVGWAMLQQTTFLLFFPSSFFSPSFH
ncbi:hypothetical protein BofuT4_uP049270.1 [Botrytis cinerea T4]|uniref:Uncharacterized protein n=1 Tax=Botryotinia fuckeliana (strain T4) TaxID=999810 RepID=G2XZM2_BOTF4|nr:hypothetical protein BofuT4_uP049270.1 [Botrytis cinerea T4]